jgi:hypothetical protein
MTHVGELEIDSALATAKRRVTVCLGSSTAESDFTYNGFADLYSIGDKWFKPQSVYDDWNGTDSITGWCFVATSQREMDDCKLTRGPVDYPLRQGQNAGARDVHAKAVSNAWTWLTANNGLKHDNKTNVDSKSSHLLALVGFEYTARDLYDYVLRDEYVDCARVCHLGPEGKREQSQGERAFANMCSLFHAKWSADAKVLHTLCSVEEG